MHIRGFADPVRNYKIFGLYDDLVEQGNVIREERDGVRILLNLERQDKAGAVQALESVLARSAGAFGCRLSVHLEIARTHLPRCRTSVSARIWLTR